VITNIQASGSTTDVIVQAGETLTWRLTLHNISAITLAGVVVTDVLPAVFTVRDATPGYTAYESGVRWLIDLPALSTTTLTVTGDFTPPAGNDAATPAVNTVEYTAASERGAARSAPVVIMP
jgi:uncharacterized repeat protein (TIGR01451 family)